MDDETNADQDIKRRDFATMCLAVLTLTTVGLSLWACGDDLTFPGKIPPTSTPTMTATPVDTETPTNEG